VGFAYLSTGIEKGLFEGTNSSTKAAKKQQFSWKLAQLLGERSLVTQRQRQETVYITPWRANRLFEC